MLFMAGCQPQPQPQPVSLAIRSGIRLLSKALKACLSMLSRPVCVNAGRFL
jgi:hypothetical protein